MSYLEDHYKTDKYGNLSKEELERAKGNKHLEELSNGCLWDRQTGAEYLPDGTKK